VNGGRKTGWLIAAVFALLIGGMLVAVFIWHAKRKPGTAAGDGGPAVAAPADGAAPSAAGDQPVATGSTPGAAVIVRTDGGVLLTNRAGPGGSIVERDGRILIAAEGRPGPEPTPAAAESAAPTGQEPAAVASEAEAGEGPAVMRYLRRLDALQAGPVGVSPDRYGRRLASGLAKGDTAALDELIENLSDVLARARRISPPAPCAELQAEVVDVLADSRTMLEKMRDLVTRGDLVGLKDLQREAEKLQRRTDAIERMKNELRRRYSAG
jgi:hypothetical protein